MIPQDADLQDVRGSELPVNCTGCGTHCTAAQMQPLPRASVQMSYLLCTLTDYYYHKPKPMCRRYLCIVKICGASTAAIINGRRQDNGVQDIFSGNPQRLQASKPVSDECNHHSMTQRESDVQPRRGPSHERA